MAPQPGSQIAAADLAAIEAAPDSSVKQIEEPHIAMAKYVPPMLADPGMPLRKVKIPFNFSSARVSLIVFIILLIMTVVMGSFALYSLTNGQVNVTVNSPVTNTGDTGGSTNPIAVGEPNPSTPIIKTDIYVYLIANAADFPGGLKPDELPVGSVRMAGEADGYVVPHLTAAAYAATDTVKKALTDLLTFNVATLTDTHLTNPLFGKDLVAEITMEAAGRTKLNLKGNWPTDVGTPISFMKDQIERTVQKYTFDYVVTLNGSETAYRCLGSSSAECLK